MAYLHAGAYGCLYAVLVVGDDQCGCQLVRLPIPDPDSSENTAQDMGFHGFFAMCLFHLREDAHSRLCLVSVLGSEDFLYLIIEIVFLADVHHAPDDLIMVDALHRIVVDVIFFIGALKCLEVHHFNSVFLEVKLLLSFHYCQCRFHIELNFIKLILSFASHQVCICHPWNGCSVTAKERSGIP